MAKERKLKYGGLKRIKKFIETESSENKMTSSRKSEHRKNIALDVLS